MKQTRHSSKKSKTRVHLFKFTEHEEVRMIRAVKASVLFMENFGKGRQPQMINRDNYL